MSDELVVTIDPAIEKTEGTALEPKFLPGPYYPQACERTYNMYYGIGGPRTPFKIVAQKENIGIRQFWRRIRDHRTRIHEELGDEGISNALENHVSDLMAVYETAMEEFHDTDPKSLNRAGYLNAAISARESIAKSLGIDKPRETGREEGDHTVQVVLKMGTNLLNPPKLEPADEDVIDADIS